MEKKMQEQEYNGKYGKPEEMDLLDLKRKLERGAKRVITFSGYGEDGKPTKELRNAWRRHKRNPII